MATAEEQILERAARDPRRAWGWGPSELASPEEKRAWAQLEMPQNATPIQRLGDRPLGITRRGMRMQAEWDAQYAQALEQERVLQQMEMDKKRYNLQIDQENRMRGQYELDLETTRAQSARENRVLEEAKMIQEAIMGGKYIGDKDGVPQFTAPITPEDDQAMEKLQNVAKYLYGMENPAARKLFETVYDDVVKFRNSKLEDVEKNQQQAQEWLIKQQEEASSLGLDTSKFFVQDKTTGQIKNVDQLGLSKAIGEARRADIENKKKEVASSKIDEETKKQASSIISQIEDTDKLIRETNFKAQRETNPRLRDEHLSNAEFYRSERELLAQRFANLVPQAAQEQPQQPEAAQPKELSERDQAALNWANANPEDPRSQRIKAKLGVQ